MEFLSSLGPLIKIYEENKKASSINTIIGLAVLALVPVMIVFFLGEKELSFNKFLFGFSAIFAAVGGLGAVWSSLRNSGARVSVYEYALVVEKRREKRTIYWADITTVTEKVEKMYVNNQYVYDRYNYRILTAAGETFELSNLISHIDEIGRWIKEKTFENLFQSFINQLAAGRRLTFGSVTMDKHKLGEVFWAELSSFRVKEGIIEIKNRTGKNVMTLDYGATPNAHILVAILKVALPFEE